MNLYKSYASGNNPLSASDKGLNFNQLLFNAPQPLNNHVQVAKLDYILDRRADIPSRYGEPWSGIPAFRPPASRYFPARHPSQQTLDNSRGISAHYTYVITPTLVNVVQLRLYTHGRRTTGTLNVVPEFGFTDTASEGAREFAHCTDAQHHRRPDVDPGKAHLPGGLQLHRGEERHERLTTMNPATASVRPCC